MTDNCEYLNDEFERAFYKKKSSHCAFPFVFSLLCQLCHAYWNTMYREGCVRSRTRRGVYHVKRKMERRRHSFHFKSHAIEISGRKAGLRAARGWNRVFEKASHWKTAIIQGTRVPSFRFRVAGTNTERTPRVTYPMSPRSSRPRATSTLLSVTPIIKRRRTLRSIERSREIAVYSEIGPGNT